MKTLWLGLATLCSLTALALSLVLVLAPEAVRGVADAGAREVPPAPRAPARSQAALEEEVARLRAEFDRWRAEAERAKAERAAVDAARAEPDAGNRLNNTPRAEEAAPEPSGAADAVAKEATPAAPATDAVGEKVEEVLRERDRKRRERMQQDFARMREQMAAEQAKRRDRVMQRLVEEAFVTPATAQRARDVLDRRDERLQSLYQEMMRAGGGMIAFAGDMSEAPPFLPPLPPDNAAPGAAQGRDRDAIQRDLDAARAQAGEELAQLLTPDQRQALDRIQREESPRGRAVFVAEGDEAAPSPTGGGADADADRKAVPAAPTPESGR
ncbi:MAG: hypothetical protein HY719_15640 [Planctomycetes bacterium]|nr:hypothetical protein [Planctomycetota bacterium]